MFSGATLVAALGNDGVLDIDGERRAAIQQKTGDEAEYSARRSDADAIPGILAKLERRVDAANERFAPHKPASRDANGTMPPVRQGLPFIHAAAGTSQPPSRRAAPAFSSSPISSRASRAGGRRKKSALKSR